MNERLYEINRNTRGTPMRIIRYENSADIDVEFLDEFHYIKEHQTYQNFKRGVVKNPYDRIVHGVGYIGLGDHPTKVDDKTSRTYNIWHEIIARCYGEKEKEKYPAYYGTSTVCSEWQCFHTFADWYEAHKYDVNERLHVDKDILYPGNKVYAPNRCLVIPQRISMIFMNKSNNRGLPNGIVQQGNGYLAKYNTRELGVYDTVMDAYEVYAQAKEEYIKQVADEYKEIIPEQVYNALYKYKVDIRNDKNYNAA